MEKARKIINAVGQFLLINFIMLFPVFIILLGFDFVADLHINFFETYSVLRIIFYIWFLIVNIAYFKNELKDLV